MVYALEKLCMYALSNTAINHISIYLSNRTQKIVFGGIESDTQDITTGVPQGSIITTTLFLIFINDIFEQKLNCKLTMFANDCTIFTQQPLLMILRLTCKEFSTNKQGKVLLYVNRNSLCIHNKFSIENH